MSRPGIWLAGCVVFSIIIGLTINHTKIITDNIYRDVLNSIDDPYFDKSNLKIDGRDVIFIGETSSMADRNLWFQHAREVGGVRNIIDNLSVYIPKPAFGLVKIKDKQVSFTGQFNSETKVEEFNDIINRVFVDYEKKLSATFSDKILPFNLPLDFELVLRILYENNISFEFSNEQVSFEGKLYSIFSNILLDNAITQQLGTDVRYINHLKVDEIQENILFALEKHENRIVITGSAIDKSTLKRLLTYINAYFPEDKIQTDINQIEGLALPDDIEIGLLIPELKDIANPAIIVTSNLISLRGQVGSLAVKKTIGLRLAELTGRAKFINKLSVNAEN